MCGQSGGGRSSESEEGADSREGILSVSDGGGVIRRGWLRSCEMGMLSMVLKKFVRSWWDAARAQKAEEVSGVVQVDWLS